MAPPAKEDSKVDGSTKDDQLSIEVDKIKTAKLPPPGSAEATSQNERSRLKAIGPEDSLNDTSTKDARIDTAILLNNDIAVAALDDTPANLNNAHRMTMANYKSS